MLDCIRGVAALMVLTRHTPEFWNFQFYRSYLAVDLFFVLSGFVIANAYESRLASGQMSVRRFVAVRIIRFYPMYGIALVFSMAVLLFCHRYKPWVNYLSATVLWRSFVLEAFFIPTPSAKNDLLYHIVRVVTWTLAWELLVNILYGVWRRWLNDRTIAVVLVVCAVELVGASLHFGNLNVGFVWNTGHMLTGAARSIFGIFAGVLLYRHKESLWSRMPAMGNSLSLAIICVMLISPDAQKFNWLVDVVCVIFLFPASIICASQHAPRRFVKLTTLLGVLSFPIYLLHGAFGLALYVAKPRFVVVHAPYSGIAMVSLLCLVSFALERWIDLPMRRSLAKRLIG